MTPTELALIDRWQRDFPLTARPFEVVGRLVGRDEAALIATFEGLRQRGVISRIGAVVKPHTLGASTLAALRAPAERLEQVADLVSSQPLVTHNYQREHALNLWFVIAGPRRSAVAATLADIAHLSGFAVIDLPLVKAYHLDLGFPLAGPPRRRSPPLAVGDYAHSARDRELLAAIEDGIPLTPQPYRTVGQCLGLGEEEVIGSLQRMVTATVITRFGCVVRHRALGYGANAMAVWDVPDERVDAVAQRFILSPHVTLCYRRPRRRPEWPYNLFCMVHAKTRAEAQAVVADLNAVAGCVQYEQAVLFSTRCFKQRGAVFSDREGARDAA